jgi:hypothetical protein
MLFNEPNLTGGIDTAIATTAQSVPLFPIMILFFVWFVVLVGGAANQKKRIGTADYPFWAVMSGLTVTFLSLLLTLKSGIIDGTTLGIVIAVTILSGVWFFLSKQRGEQ